MRDLGFIVKSAKVAAVWLILSGIVVALLSQQAYAAAKAADKVGLPCEKVRQLTQQEATSLSEEELFALAAAYEYGECVAQDYRRAYEGYRILVERGERQMRAKPGDLFLKGMGVERDLNKARYWFRSYALATFSAQDNLMVALLRASLFEAGLPDMLQQEIDRAIEDGKGPVDVWMRNYHDLYSGNGLYPDRSGAMHWLHLAVMSRYPAAYYEKAHRALEDEDDFDVYKINLALAAEANYPQAQVEYGKLYLTGEGVRRWPYMAMVWFPRAQKNGLNVDELIQEAERQLDPLDRELAVKRAAEFDFSRG